MARDGKEDQRMTTAEDRRAAFAAWDAYKPAAERTYREMVPSLPHGEPTILDNPLSMVTYADGYLAGLAAGRDEQRRHRREDMRRRRAVMTPEQKAARRVYAREWMRRKRAALPLDLTEGVA